MIPDSREEHKNPPECTRADALVTEKRQKILAALATLRGWMPAICLLTIHVSTLLLNFPMLHTKTRLSGWVTQIPSITLLRSLTSLCHFGDSLKSTNSYHNLGYRILYYIILYYTIADYNLGALKPNPSRSI